MKKHSARVAPLSACNSPVLTLTKVEGNGPGRRGLERGSSLLATCAPGAAPRASGGGGSVARLPREAAGRGLRAAHPAASCPALQLLRGLSGVPWVGSITPAHPIPPPGSQRRSLERAGCRRRRHPARRSEPSSAHQPSDAPRRGRASR